jgi:hypothetical protein
MEPGPVFREILRAGQDLQLEKELESREAALVWLDVELERR